MSLPWDHCLTATPCSLTPPPAASCHAETRHQLFLKLAVQPPRTFLLNIAYFCLVLLQICSVLFHFTKNHALASLITAVRSTFVLVIQTYWYVRAHTLSMSHQTRNSQQRSTELLSSRPTGSTTRLQPQLPSPVPHQQLAPDCAKIALSDVPRGRHLTPIARTRPLAVNPTLMIIRVVRVSTKSDDGRSRAFRLISFEEHEKM